LLSGNGRMAALVSGLLPESARLVNFGVLSHPQSDATAREHGKLLAAMAAGDAALARKIAEAHIGATRQMVVQSLLADRRLEDTPITV
jgi:DNA-binding GntR family transcriptional regulator